MMTSDTDVNTAAESFLRHYLRQCQHSGDEAEAEAEGGQADTDKRQAPATPATPRTQTVDAPPPPPEVLPLYDSLDRARAACSAAAASAAATGDHAAPPSMSQCVSLSLVAQRGSNEGSILGARSRPAHLPTQEEDAADGDGEDTAAPPTGVGMFAGRRVRAAPSPAGGSGGGGVAGGVGGGSVSASAGSPALLPTTPRSASLGGDRDSAGGGGGAAAGGRPRHSALEVKDTDASPPRRRLRGILRRRKDADGPAAGGGGSDAAVAIPALDGADRAVAAWSKARQRQAAPAGWLAQVRVLTWRELLSMTRNPADVAGRMLIFCWVAVVVGIIFYGIGDYFESIRSRMDVLFIEVCVLLLLPYVYMSLYTADKQYYMADLGAKLYRPSAYYVAKVLAVLPFGILSMLVFCFTIYGMSGLRKDVPALAEHAVLCVLAYLIASQVLYAAAVATPNQDTAFMVAIAWTAVNILMSNFLIRYQDMDQVWLTWALRWFSTMSWAFQGMTAAEFRNQLYSCAGGFGTPVLDALPGLLPTNPALHPNNFLKRALDNPGSDCAIDTDLILNYFGWSQPFWRLAVILLGYLGALHIITYVALRLMAGRERR